MKKIQLTQGKFALVDDEDYEEMSSVKWCANKNGNSFYAMRCAPRTNSKRVGVYMHRVIMNAPQNKYVDHINGDGLDNRRSNLRLCTGTQNQCNRWVPKNNTSGFKGVYFNKIRAKWGAYININKKPTNLGYFTEKIEAANAYNIAARKHHGEFAFLNRIEL